MGVDYERRKFGCLGAVNSKCVMKVEVTTGPRSFCLSIRATASQSGGKAATSDQRPVNRTTMMVELRIEARGDRERQEDAGSWAKVHLPPSDNVPLAMRNCDEFGRWRDVSNRPSSPESGSSDQRRCGQKIRREYW